MEIIVNITQIAANLATVAAVGAAIYGVVKAYRAQREATALGIWKDYVQLALSHPELASPGSDLFAQDRKTEKFRKYEWFVSAMLFACEQIVVLQPDDPEWRASVLDHLRIHRHYLASARFHPDRYSSELRELIIKATAEIEQPNFGNTGSEESRRTIEEPRQSQ